MGLLIVTSIIWDYLAEMDYWSLITSHSIKYLPIHPTPNIHTHVHKCIQKQTKVSSSYMSNGYFSLQFLWTSKHYELS